MEFSQHGHAGELTAYRWHNGDEPTWIAVLVHGYGEHLGRYQWVAGRLAEHGAAVYGVDHQGHGKSSGDRAVIDDFDAVVGDVRSLVQTARAEHPGLPVVLIGHSMGGMIAARYLQLHPDDIAAAALTGPVLGSWPVLDQLRGVDDIPDLPIDPDTLSRDPEIGRAYAEDPLVYHGPFKRPMLDALQTSLDRINDGGRLRVPTIWLHGADDQLVPIEATRAGWEQIAPDDSESRTYPDARHEILNETNRDEVLADLLAFTDAHR
ncbi:alpha-beta hydrolase superfamily lysophospholipase [Naumannella cuiyingiana]|uniref:Alpha-beta hydrolase superfamily lysophospholipase n=1 Tax=Naumannella cuiyingiana TaxID=1347891 RepID=A0A7Z0D9K0_9ACTN|nr:alpha/beta hydrolase [Naumannella cuiyingiana]NYI71500.1 alpha-beta hydrolase superfamily lysophospholipase [Naumannella cuiyingiana]